MAGSVANLLLKIISAGGGASGDVEELAASLEALDHTKAEATAQVDTDQGSFDQLVLELKAFDHSTSKAKAEVDADFSQLELFTKKLEGIQSRTFKGKLFKDDPGAFTKLPEPAQMKLDINTGDVVKAESDLAALETQLTLLNSHGAVDIPVNVDLGAALAKLQSWNTSLKALNENIDVQVDVEVGKALTDLEALQMSLAVMNGQKVNIETDVDRDGRTRQAMGQLNNAFGRLSSAGDGLSSAMSGVTGGLGKVTVNMGMFGARLGPAVILVGSLAAIIVTSLVAALAALAASAALAAVALVGLGVALAAAILPMIAVAIPAFLAFGKVIQVLKQQQQEAAAAAQKKAQADRDARQYAQQHADAERNLAEAVTAAGQAQKDAYREMQDAIEKVTDSVRELERAHLSAEQAALNVEKADLALKKFRQEAGMASKQFDAMFNTFKDRSFDPSKLNAALAKIKGPKLSDDKKLELKQLILDRKDAHLAEKEAIDNVSDSERTLLRAREDAAAFQEKGIAASSNYAAALKRVADAQRDLSRLEANHKWDQQHADIAKSASQTAALTSEQKKLLSAVKEIIAAFKEAFGPASTALLNGFITGMSGMGDSIKNLKGPLTALGEAMGGAISDFFKQLSSPAGQQLFTALIAGATALAPLVGQIFGSMFSLLGKIAVAAMPFLVAGFQAIADWLGAIDANTAVKDIAGFLAQIVPYLGDWVNLAGQLLPAFFDLLVAIAPYAKELMVWIGEIAKRLGDWAKSKKARDDIKQFFQDAIPIVEGLGGAVKFVIDFMIQLVGAAGRVKRAYQAANEWINTADQNIAIFFSNLKTRIAGWWDTFKQKWEEFKAWVKGLPDQIYQFGVDIAQGFIDGIESKAEAIGKAFTDPLKNAWKDAKHFFHIGSPSKLMMEMGVNVGRGFELGLQASTSGVAAAAGRSIGAPVVAAATGAAAVARGSGTTIQNQTVNLPTAPGHDQMGDARHQAAQFAMEMRRRGRR